jgi:hypothetical protein
VTITLQRRLASYRAVVAAGSARAPGRADDRARAVAIGAERLAAEVDGELVVTPTGSFVRVERRSSLVSIDRERLARLPGQPPADVPLLCLDTETTGLATASGTLAFLVGLGWWEGARFRQVQLLLPDHADEPALLDELRARIPADGWLVTYNGRGFDWPLLEARYRMAREPAPAHRGHLDLLPLVRRLFRHRMTDARLQTAEAELLGLRRHDDVPGWEIPARYLQFLRDGDPALLLGIVRHNEEDVLSLARLLAHVDQRLADPEARSLAPAGDLAGLARSFAASGRYEEALGCIETARTGIVPYRAGGSPAPYAAAVTGRGPGARPEPHRVQEEADAWWSPRRPPDFGGIRGRTDDHGAWRRAVPERLDLAWTPDRLGADRARLLRRLGRHVEAEDAWVELADLGGLLGALAWVEIAKIREHHRRDPEAALAATLAALRFVERSRLLGRHGGRLEGDLARRLARLRRRISRRAAARATT